MTKNYKIVETDNFGGDYPDEKELSMVDTKGKVITLLFTFTDATIIRNVLNTGKHDQSTRYWIICEKDRKLEGAFEP